MFGKPLPDEVVLGVLGVQCPDQRYWTQYGSADTFGRGGRSSYPVHPGHYLTAPRDSPLINLFCEMIKTISNGREVRTASAIRVFQFAA